MCVTSPIDMEEWIFKMCHNESSDTRQRRGQREEENRNNNEIKSNLQHKEVKSPRPHNSPGYDL
jgi:hypothetical protein